MRGLASIRLKSKGNVHPVNVHIGAVKANMNAQPSKFRRLQNESEKAMELTILPPRVIFEQCECISRRRLFASRNNK